MLWFCVDLSVTVNWYPAEILVVSDLFEARTSDYAPTFYPENAFLHDRLVPIINLLEVVDNVSRIESYEW